MSTVLKEERSNVLALCRNFLSAELNFISVPSEVNRLKVQEASQSVTESHMTLAEARKLATSLVAKQYLGK